jgi:three-Cys-motif partner protein
MAEAEALFDPDDWLEDDTPIVCGAGGLPTSPGDELALDEKRVLVDDDEGLKSRKVHVHSADKAHFAHYYADIVGTGMKTAYGGPLAWVELFSGPGRLYVVEEARYRAGSPVEALGIRHPFQHYVFCDLSSECIASLEQRVAARPGVHVLQGDANSAELHDRIASIVPRNALVVLYADPQGLDFELDTIRYFADRYKHLDMLINFPVRGVIRALRAGHEGKASRVLGHATPLDLIHERSRADWGPSVRTWFERQLRNMGYDQFATEVIKSHSKNSPLYDLVLASREPKAVQFFNEATKRGPRGQYTLDLGI